MKQRKMRNGRCTRWAVVAIVVLTGFGSGLPLAHAKKKATVSVTGMVCGLCAAGVEKKLREIDGVESVNVDLETMVVEVVSADDKPAPTDEQIKAAIGSAGYVTTNVARSE